MQAVSETTPTVVKPLLRGVSHEIAAGIAFAAWILLVAAAPSARARLAEVRAQVRAEKVGEVAEEFDAVHTVERARQVGSLDAIIAARELRPWLIAAVERGIARNGGR